MASFLIQFSYAPTAVAALVKKPADRSEAVKSLVAGIGGKLVGVWMSFGEYDGVILVEGAQAVDAAAVALAVSSSGAFRAYKTTPLLSMAEGVDAMRKAGTLGYAPPGA